MDSPIWMSAEFGRRLVFFIAKYTTFEMIHVIFKLHGNMGFDFIWVETVPKALLR